MIYTLTKDSLTIFLGGKPHQIDSTHQSFEQLLKIVKGEAETPSDEELKKLISIREVIQQKLANNGRVRLGHNEIIIDGIPVHNYSTDRILEMLKQGVDINPWIRFMERLIENPSSHVFSELMEWMTKGNMPVTEDGHFLAYKKVDDNLRSYHPSPDGTHLQHVVGESVSMPRYQVDDVRHNTCSTGLHFCSWDYLPSYRGSSGRVLVLKIDPAKVVTIPSDYQHTKGRAEGYQVLSVLDPEDVEFAFSNNTHPYEGWSYYEEEDDNNDDDDDYSVYYYNYDDNEPDGVDFTNLPNGAQVRCTEVLFDTKEFMEGKVYTVYLGHVRDETKVWNSGEQAVFELVSLEPKYQACSEVAGPGECVLCVAVRDPHMPYKAGHIYHLDAEARPMAFYGGYDGAWIAM